MKIQAYEIVSKDIKITYRQNGLGGGDFAVNLNIRKELKPFVTQDFMEEIVEFAQDKLIELEDKLSDKELDEIKATP